MLDMMARLKRRDIFDDIGNVNDTDWSSKYFTAANGNSIIFNYSNSTLADIFVERCKVNSDAIFNITPDITKDQLDTVIKIYWDRRTRINNFPTATIWKGNKVLLYIHDGDYRDTYIRYQLKDFIESVCREGYYAKYGIIIAHKFKETKFFIEQDSCIDFLPSYCVENSFIVS